MSIYFSEYTKYIDNPKPETEKKNLFSISALQFSLMMIFIGFLKVIK